MPRKPVVHHDGAAYHLMARGIDGRAIFASEPEKRLFYDCLLRVKKAKGFQLFAHALMPNHFHLALQVGRTQLCEIMRLVQTRFAVIYNQMHDRQGHVFQGRYKPIAIRDNAYLMTVIRYVHLNPVAGGLVSLPEHWAWSGHNELLGLAYPSLIDASVPLGLFGDQVSSARRNYLEFVYSKLDDPDREIPAPPDVPEDHGALNAPANAASERPSWTELTMESSVDRPPRPGRRAQAAGKQRLMREAFSSGYSVTEIARYLAVSVSYVSKVLSRP